MYISRSLAALTLGVSTLAVAACSGTDVTQPKLDTATPETVANFSFATVARSITLSPTSATVAVGSTITLSGSIKSALGTDLTATLASQVVATSSDTTIATISKTGVVAGLRNGVAVITAKLGLLSGSSKITVGTGVATSTPPTTPPPPPPPPTTTTPPSGGSPVSAMSLVSDDFSRYTSTQDLMANISTALGGTGSSSSALYTDGVNASLASLDNTVLYNGHATVKYNQPGGTAASPELWAGFRGQVLTKMWLRVKVRFSQGFTTTGTLANSANAYKLLGWTWNTYDGSGRVEITNTNQYQLYWNVQAKNTGTLIGGGNFANAGTITSEWSDGGWYDYIVEVDFSQAAGVARLWRAPDGQAPVLVGTSSASMFAGQGSLPQLTGVSIGMNFNQVRAANQNQAVWIGQWEVVDGTKYPNPYNLAGM